MTSPLPFSPPWFQSRNLRCDFSFATLQLTSFSASRTSRRRFRYRVSFAEEKVEPCWLPGDAGSQDGFGGWFIRKQETADRDGLRKLSVGVGASVAILLAALTYCSFSRKGFKFSFNAPFHIFHEKLTSVDSIRDLDQDMRPGDLEVDQVSKSNRDDEVAAEDNELKENILSESGGSKRIVVSVPADSTQQEALSVLKKLQIIENDVSADELCTRREFARWFVKINSKLERKRKHKIVPSSMLAGSIVTAFDDVNLDDPDFWCIQSLGEAGIVLSKLSSSDISSSNCNGSSYFFPESYLSRFDLVNWKTLLEYALPSEIDEKVIRKRVGLLDLSACPDLSVSLLMDLMAGDRSITRKTFGNTRRLQPYKPVTKAQAAVALIAGRMEEAIHAEISRIESENLSRFVEMDEIRAEFICRGEIQKYWEEKLKKEKDHEIEVRKGLQIALLDLEKERTNREESLAEYMKEKSVLDCQQQLLLSLKEEVDDLYDKLDIERASLMAEQQALEKMSSDMCIKHDVVIEAKSILEAEKEALHILRSWVEEEAMRARARAKVLEQAVRRWQCHNE
ncbi:uncharacterized protein [Typha latifolia]|uniref:uncharacterized protein isoform X1 n=1 Tax=Typha latifolia TaxID=4733 RepID=UPI003C2E8FB8